MARKVLDLTGVNGLVERYQGDLNDTASQPHARYYGEEGQFADGIYNPFKKLGYLSPANNIVETLTGTISDKVVAIEYDEEADDVYFATNGPEILKLDGLSDSSLSNHLSITSTSDIEDMVIYEINGGKALVYAIDTNNSGGMNIGFSTIGTGSYGLTTYGTNLPDTTAGTTTLAYAAASTTISSSGRQLAQSFNSSLVGSNLTVTGAMVRVKRTGGTGAGITMRVSLRAREVKTNSPYNNRGAWVTATSYAVLDVVSVSSVDYICYSAHTSGASDQPGVGGSWTDKWQRFNAPTATDLAYGDFSLANVGDGTGASSTWYGYDEVYVTFNTPVTLTAATEYWLCLAESGSVMGASDTISWISTNNAGTTLTSNYAQRYINTLNLWATYGDPATATQGRTLEFALLLNTSETWSSTIANGAFTTLPNQNTFLHLADNNLLYWFAGKSVHSVDGSIVGGNLGRVIQDALKFPDYMQPVGAAETRSRMFIAIQTSEANSSALKAYNANKCGVFVWDRKTQVVGSSDFYLAPGAKQIKNIFTSATGDVLLITINNEGFTEIRAISGNQYGVVQTLERDAYPDTKKISQIGQMNIWTGHNGIVYAYGKAFPGAKAALHKIGNPLTLGANFESGPVFVGDSNTTPRSVAILTYKNDTNKYAVRWYPNGEGTINSVVQTGNQGNVYSLVQILPSQCTIKSIDIRCLPTTLATTDVIGTVKYYFNQSSTAGITKTITLADASRGYVRHEINKHYINAVQVEIEWSTSATLGADTFYPYYAIIDYEPTNTMTKDKG